MQLEFFGAAGQVTGSCHILTVGCDLESSRKSVDLALRYPNVYAAVGIHPHDATESNVAEIDELKVQNKELAEVLKSMESSRKQYEIDAKRYRENAEDAEKKSETLRLRLDDVEKNFVEMEKQQRHALKEARKSPVPNEVNGKKKKVQKDDLQEIIGIGKVFEHALNELGIYTFAQIASFDINDIARVNAVLKGSEGRMEADDWIGQAKELHFKKYGDTEFA